MTEEIGEWLDCEVDHDYEIFSEYPYPIRRKGSDKVISEHFTNDGYVRCCLNNRKYLRHRIIAQQFLPNPNNLPQVDHINHNRADNRIENLRWTSKLENMKNMSGQRRYHFTFLDELPDTSERLDAYNGHEFDGLFVDYENQKLYLWNGALYRELLLLRDGGYLYYNAYDIENKQRKLSHKLLFG